MSLPAVITVNGLLPNLFSDSLSWLQLSFIKANSAEVAFIRLDTHCSVANASLTLWEAEALPSHFDFWVIDEP